MDVNGTRFQLLLGEVDFKHATDETGTELERLWVTDPASAPVEWDDRRDELTLHGEDFRFPPPAGQVPPRLEDRRGAARDRFGSWYWIDPSRAGILVESAGSGNVSTYWDSAAVAEARRERGGRFTDADPRTARPLPLAGLAVTSDHFLVVGVEQPAGVLAFDLQDTGPPRLLVWPSAVEFVPFDVAARPGGGVAVLDRVNRRAWELDRTLTLMPARWNPPVAAPGEFGGIPVQAAAADATALAGDPIAIAVAGDGALLVLDRNPGKASSLVRRYRDDEETGPAAATADEAVHASVIGHDMALSDDVLFVADAQGDQAYAFTVAVSADGGLALALERSFYPMRLFGGRGLAATPTGAAYDFADRWVPLARAPGGRFRSDGALVTPRLDGHVPDCVWHRLFLDACLPPGTAVSVWTAASDEPEAVDPRVAVWQREPALGRRAGGLELPFAGDRSGPYDTWELLFQRARGRYLRIKLELRGDGRSSPRIRALRAWYPRFSYLERYLPAAYAEDPESASFLERFLANLEGIETGIEDRIATAQGLLSPAIAPADALEWLAGFFDAALDPAWDEARRRLFLAHASDFFRTRGTIRGIELALRLAFDPCVDPELFTAAAEAALHGPRIVETYRTRATPAVLLGDPTELALPRVLDRTATWDASEGTEALHERWREYLTRAGVTPGADERYPLTDPGGARHAAWIRFADEVLAGRPAVATDVEDWRSFLARRYGSVEALNAVYGTALESFALVELPAAVPADGAPLVDWFQFQAIVMPMRRRAHRFTVLLPRRERDDPAETDRLRGLAERIVTVQKPAHTLFAVKFFWSAFRLGEARLGRDTVAGSGSRAPELVLGAGHLGENVLGGPPAGPWIRRPDPGPPTSEDAS
jgi:phage tail-like protein